MTNVQAIEWTGAPIDVVSLGVGDPDTLPRSARSALNRADAVIGARHHFTAIAPLEIGARRIPFPSPMADLGLVLTGLNAERVAVLASGDALFYGIGRLLTSLVGRNHLRFHANISSIQACFHTLGRDWQDARVVSLHGRPLSELRRYLEAGALLAVFTDGEATPRAIAAELDGQGFGDSIVWVCEAMGSGDEAVTRFTAAGLAGRQTPFHALNVCIAQLRGRGRMPVFPGIPDHELSTGAEPGFGMISKREVRLAILSFMQPTRGEIAWDIGAGCGSVSIEWARWNPGGEIHAVEVDPERIEHLDINRRRFGVESNCHVTAGRAPAVCDALPDPACVFIGGSSGRLDAIIDYAWRRLPARGKLVASGVTETSRSLLAGTWRAFSERGIECEWSEIGVTKTLPGAAQTRQLKPVVLFKATKPEC